MAETTVPAAEAETVAPADEERASYELAFHILPTVAEGEVASVFDALKKTIADHGGEIFDEEAPERFELAYEIVKPIEGKNRKFKSAYFGWVRFRAYPNEIQRLTEELELSPQILRFLLIRLTKAEEEHPFRFHEALKDAKMVTTVEESSVIPDVTTISSEEELSGVKREEEEEGEVDEEALEEALEKKEI